MSGEPASQQIVPQWFPSGQAQNITTLDESLVMMRARDRAQLVVSFSHSDDIGHPELDYGAYLDAVAAARDWSHVAVITKGPGWFREADLIAHFANLGANGFFESYARVLFFGAERFGAGFAALSFSACCPNATVLAFGPQSTLRSDLADWDCRFPEAEALDWRLPHSDAAAALSEGNRAYIVHDSFQRENRRHMARMPTEICLELKAFGLGGDACLALRRLDRLVDMIEQAAARSLTPALFYRWLRGRKNLVLYRRALEKHLSERGQKARRAQFAALFRKHKRRLDAERKRLKAARQPTSIDHGTLPPPPVRAANRAWPRSLGNVWMLQPLEDGFRYLSDQYRGQLMGFVERAGITLAETPPLALGIAAFGEAVGVEREIPETFHWHVVDETLNGRMPARGARAAAIAHLRLAAQKGTAYRTMVALSQPQASLTASEALPDSALYQGLLTRIRAARAALRAQGKDFFLQEVRLGLLGGAPQTNETTALHHYGQVIQAMRQDAAHAAGQASSPYILVVQSAGTDRDGCSEVILAEGQLERLFPALNVIVASPSYPYALMAGSAATHDPRAQMRMDELCAHAIAARQAGKEWYCPAMIEARQLGPTTLLVTFSAMADLELGPGPHGFALAAGPSHAQVNQVEVFGKTVRLTLNQPVSGAELAVSYAWGQRSDAPDSFTANRGALRDKTAIASQTTRDGPLYRYALAGRIKVMPSDHPAPVLPEHAP